MRSCASAAPAAPATLTASSSKVSAAALRRSQRPQQAGKHGVLMPMQAQRPATSRPAHENPACHGPSTGRPRGRTRRAVRPPPEQPLRRLAEAPSASSSWGAVLAWRAPTGCLGGPLCTPRVHGGAGAAASCSRPLPFKRAGPLAASLGALCTASCACTPLALSLWWLQA